jgi:glycosyltransferase involved in cell wall biosynthesis
MFRRGGLRDRIVGWLADLPRRKADGVVALGPCMAERLVRRGVPAERIVVAHNWADGEAIRPRPFVRDGRLKVLYSGNLGLAHDVETFQGAAEALARRRAWFVESFLFRFSGGGPRRKEVAEWAKGEGFANVEFAGYAPRAALGAQLGACDVGLVTQKAETVGTVVPSKAYGIWAAGRGVLFVGPRDATIGRVIAEHGVGWQVDNGDARGLAGLLAGLQENPEEVEETGRRARILFEKEFDLPVGVRRVWGAFGVG